VIELLIIEKSDHDLFVQNLIENYQVEAFKKRKVTLITVLLSRLMTSVWISTVPKYVVIKELVAAGGAIAPVLKDAPTGHKTNGSPLRERGPRPTLPKEEGSCTDYRSGSQKGYTTFILC